MEISDKIQLGETLNEDWIIVAFQLLMMKQIQKVDMEKLIKQADFGNEEKQMRAWQDIFQIYFQ